MASDHRGRGVHAGKRTSDAMRYAKHRVGVGLRTPPRSADTVKLLSLHFLIQVEQVKMTRSKCAQRN